MPALQWFALTALLVSGGGRAHGDDNDKPGHVPEGFFLQWEPDVGDFLLQAELMQTGRDYGHQTPATPSCQVPPCRSNAGPPKQIFISNDLTFGSADANVPTIQNFNTFPPS